MRANLGRRCCRTTCSAPAIATLTFSYADSQAVLGPLSAEHEPGAYDLCREHAARMSVPKGWEVVRLPFEQVSVGPSGDDLMALAAAVREIGLRTDGPVSEPGPASGVVSLAEHRHRRHAH